MKKNKGFTVLELLIVVGIIAILMGMVGTSAFIARKHAYKAQAQTEVQQLAMAVKSIFLTHKDSKFPLKTGRVRMNSDALKSFTVEIKENEQRAFLEIPTSRLEDGAYLDPWGNMYEYTIEDVKEEEMPEEVFQIVVSFPNSEKFYFRDDYIENPEKDKN